MRAAIIVLVGPMVLAAVSRQSYADERFFREQVAPIFAEHCVRCHRTKAAKGELDLTQRQGLLTGGESGPALVAGKPDESLLLDYISGDEPEMPKNAKPLSEKQVATIRQWVAAGADWPQELILKEERGKWWSLQPLHKPAVPDPQDKTKWVRTPIDAFILSRLRAEGLQPTGEADRRTLIRRLTYNLHGLPPTPEEIDAFVHNPREDAYEKLVDRLLDSPRYGERWARHWLDVVHYGDTHGFDKDKRRPHAWPYRDYLIRAFNSDKPYRRFVLEQLAGDLLFADHPDGIVATGFIVAGPWDFVGHVELREGTLDKNITRNLDRDDMVTNTMSTFTSLTVHCARCHDHKFDPITQRDYYSLQAVFAGVERTNRPYVVDEASARQRRELTERNGRLDDQLAAIEKSITSPELQEAERKIAALEKGLASAGNSSPTNGYHSRIMQTPEQTKWVQVDLGKTVALESISLIPARPTDFPDTPGFGFPLRFKVEVSNESDFGNARVIADQTKTDLPYRGDAPFEISGDLFNDLRARYIRVTATKLWKRTDDYIFALAELQAQSNGGNVAAATNVTALDSIEAGRWSTRHLVDGFSSRGPLGEQLLIDGKTVTREALAARLGNLKEKSAQLRDSLIDEQTKQKIEQLERERTDLRDRLARLPAEPLVYAATPAFKKQGNFSPPPHGKPRPIHLLNRGSVKSPGEPMSPGALSCIPQLPARFELADAANEGERRVALARWITDEKNPLTWRSIVNRVWHYHFGRGLVESPNDFGRMGTEPTHPALLDWLAAEFRDGHGSLKELHRLILTSSVYRQSSASHERLAKIDAGNRFLWRMNRHRLEVESIRDAVLSVTGKLDLTMYGPGFDRFGFKDDHSPHYYYDRHDVDDPGAWRRTIYRFIVRSVPDPFMDSLDCADPSINVPVRNQTITALQALALLNNRFMVRQSELFAERIQKQNDTLSGQITAAYRLALGREPTANETAALATYTKQHGLPNGCRLILNLNEFVFVD